MTPGHPFLDQLDSSLAPLIPKEPIEFAGEWSAPERRVQQYAGQSAAGPSPLDVIDVRWSGALISRTAIAALAFLVTESDLFWTKSVLASTQLPVDVSLHAYAELLAGRATFAASVGNSFLPGVPIDCGTDLAGSCTVTPQQLITAQVHQLASAGRVSLVVVALPRQCIEVKRHHLWRLKENFASDLPQPVREILTRRRAGAIG